MHRARSRVSRIAKLLICQAASGPCAPGATAPQSKPDPGTLLYEKLAVLGGAVAAPQPQRLHQQRNCQQDRQRDHARTARVGRPRMQTVEAAAGYASTQER
jgi:hypothetical protein